MGTKLTWELTTSTGSVNVQVNRANAGLTGATVEVRFRNPDVADAWLDQNDATWKTNATVTTLGLAMTEIDAVDAPGLYAATLDFVSTVGAQKPVESMEAIYVVTSPVNIPGDVDVIELVANYLNVATQAQILSDATPFPGASIDAAISTRATQAQILSDATPFAGADVAAILADTAAMQPLVDVATSTRAAPGDAMDLVADAVDAAALAADAVTEIQAGLATAAALATVQSDTDDIQTRLPAVLVSGRMDADVGAMQAGTVTAAVIATDAIDADALSTDALQEIADHLETNGTNPHGTGNWDAVGVGITAQQVRDAMKLAPAVGAPAAGSVDDHLDGINLDTAAIDLRLPNDPADESNQLAQHAATQAAVALNETEVAAAVRETTNTAEHATTVAAVGDVETDTQDIQARLPAALVSGAMDSDVSAFQLAALNQIDNNLAVTNAHGAGAWDAVGGGLTQQQARDAMKLAPSAGVPAAGSVDEHLDEINVDTAAIDLRLPPDPADESLQQASHAATQAAVTLNETEAAALTRANADAAAHAATQAAVALNETEIAATARAVTNQAEHDQTQTDIGNLNDPSAAEINTELEVTAGHGAGLWTSGGGLTQQQARDAMKLAPSAGVPAAGSVDDKLDDIITNTQTIISGAVVEQVLIGVAYEDTIDELRIDAFLLRSGKQITAVDDVTIEVYNADDSLLFAALTDNTADSQGVFRMVKSTPGLSKNSVYTVVATVNSPGGTVVTTTGFKTLA